MKLQYLFIRKEVLAVWYHFAYGRHPQNSVFVAQLRTNRFFSYELNIYFSIGKKNVFFSIARFCFSNLRTHSKHENIKSMRKEIFSAKRFFCNRWRANFRRGLHRNLNFLRFLHEFSVSRYFQNDFQSIATFFSNFLAKWVTHPGICEEKCPKWRASITELAEHGKRCLMKINLLESWPW